MANWCENSVLLTAPTAALADQLHKAVVDEAVPSMFSNMPDEGDIGGEGLRYGDVDGTEVTLEFWSRNEPPIEFYRYLRKNGWGVSACYCEPSWQFYGYFDEGVHTRIEYERVSQMSSDIFDQFGFLFNEDDLNDDDEDS